MEKKFVLNDCHSAANHYLAELRDVYRQKDAFKFKHNLTRLGFLLAYEISKSLPYDNKTIQTPLGKSKVFMCTEEVVLLGILRAALPFCDGFSEVFEQANIGFIGAGRMPQTSSDAPDIQLSYVAIPEMKDKIVILIDPMLATGNSILKVIDQTEGLEDAKKLIIASVVAAPEGVAALQNTLPSSAQLWTCAIDDRLNENYYIVPGLGDAGDLAFGVKK